MSAHITITPTSGRVRVLWHGHVIADTTKALDLKEGSYSVTRYIPRQDVNMSYLERTTHQTTCPYKGAASYFSLVADGKTDANAIWTYETPKADVAEIANYVAFYPNKVTIEVV